MTLGHFGNHADFSYLLPQCVIRIAGRNQLGLVKIFALAPGETILASNIFRQNYII